MKFTPSDCQRRSNLVRWTTSALVGFAAAFLLCGGALAQDKSAPAPPAQPRPVLSPAQIEKLVNQLGASDYRTREEASRTLMAVGSPAMEPLAKAAKSNDLEVSYRAVQLLESLLDEDDSADRQRAADILESLAARSPSAVSDLATDVMTIYRLTQQDRAIEKLEKLGAVISNDLLQLPPGTLQVTINGTRWNGKSSDLELLKQLPSMGWLRIIHVNVDDSIVKTLAELRPNAPVLEQPKPSDQPSPKVATPADQPAPSTVKPDGPKPLEKQNVAKATDAPKPADPGSRELPPSQIKPNVKPASPAADATAKRGQASRLFQIDLYGTGISEATTGKLASALPNVKVERRNGALLGVEGMPGLNACSINGVRPGTAAAEADIRPGDEIATFDGVTVHNFEEFTAQVSTKFPGDKVTLEIRRGEQTLSKELTLGRWEE
jgi:hypothetical protein